jgi:hypothetical protein
MPTCNARCTAYVTLMKKQTKKLILEREAVRTLSVDQSRYVRGGDGNAAPANARLVMYNYDGKPVSRYH